MIQEVLGLKSESRDAVAALQPGRRHETAPDQTALLLGQTLQGEDLFVLDASCRHGTGDLRQAIDQCQATTTLTLWLTTILGGEDSALIAQGLQEALIGANGQRLPATVERELDQLP